MTVDEFGPIRLRQFRETLIGEDLARRNVNQTVNAVRAIFKWGVSHELVRPAILEALRAVEPLKYGKTSARETEPIKPVPEALVMETLEYCSPQIAAMVRLQMLTGMRSGEVTIMRTGDLNTSGVVWEYRPQYHKTSYRGEERVVFIGPDAQAVLKPWLRVNLQDYLFQPAEVDQWRRDQLHSQRKTPLLCGNRPGTNRADTPRQFKPYYDTMAYRQGIDHAIAKCNKARKTRGEGPISWHPHQLRHNAATRIRREYDIETARVVLGHKSAAITTIYAEADQSKAAAAIAKMG